MRTTGDRSDSRTVDLALAAVPDLPAPASALAEGSLKAGHGLLIDAYPNRERAAVPVVSADAGRVTVLASIAPGASGGPGMDSAGRVAMILMASDAATTWGFGPELLVPFVWYATPRLMAKVRRYRS